MHFVHQELREGNGLVPGSFVASFSFLFLYLFLLEVNPEENCRIENTALCLLFIFVVIVDGESSMLLAEFHYRELMLCALELN